MPIAVQTGDRAARYQRAPEKRLGIEHHLLATRMRTRALPRSPACDVSGTVSRSRLPRRSDPCCARECAPLLGSENGQVSAPINQNEAVVQAFDHPPDGRSNHVDGRQIRTYGRRVLVAT